MSYCFTSSSTYNKSFPRRSLSRQLPALVLTTAGNLYFNLCLFARFCPSINSNPAPVLPCLSLINYSFIHSFTITQPVIAHKGTEPRSLPSPIWPNLSFTHSKDTYFSSAIQEKYIWTSPGLLSVNKYERYYRPGRECAQQL